MNKIRISAVRYANTYPFIYGLKHSAIPVKAVIETDHPADCARKLSENRADLGLVPVGAIPSIGKSYITGSYCIGSNGKVRTVMLLSNSELDEIKFVYLDYRSRTSINLVKVLARKKWKKDFLWMNTSENFDFLNIGDKAGVVLIGDQCFEFEKMFRKKYDLGEEWSELTGLPFVFACWISNRHLDEDFVSEFDEALRNGVDNIEKVVEEFGNTGSIRGGELYDYLTNNIDFKFDDAKKEGMKYFLKMMEEL
ncbi:MAG: menaquinone biosynthesis protein [Bacteroidales bacterium]|nr:menaquinone biosynthesis protein [Bacteroidales bacterium]